ncbi:MAG: thiamine-phosphate kinase [Haloarculaceae archaeon]
MDERAALARLAESVPGAGDDAAVVGDLVVTTDMLHATTDFPDGTTRYTAGWRAVGASLSDVAAMGADPLAAVAAYGAPAIEWADIEPFVAGASAVCEAAGADYVGGDLDSHGEFTVASTAVGRAEAPVTRGGATPGEVVCVTGTLGRSGAALQLFEAGDADRGNALFRFQPRVGAGRALAGHATAMMDSSDGLARSLHQLAEAGDCGFAIETPLPLDDAVDAVASGEEDRLELGAFFGEDFELVCTLPEERLSQARDAVPCELTPVGTVTDSGVTLDGDPLPDRGYTHG